MLCGKCGTEVQNDAVFCPNCGEQICVPNVNNQVSSVKAGKFNKKLFKIIITLTLAMALLVSGIKFIGCVTNKPSNEEIKLAANNLVNGGFVASDGKWLFYYEHGKKGLYRERLSNGKKKELVLPEEVQGELFFLGDKLYVESISAYSTMKVNDKECVEIPNTTFTAQKFQTDGKKCYFGCFSNQVDKGNVVSQKLDGNKGKTIAPITSSRIMFNGEYLYVFSPYGSVDDEENLYKGVTKMDANGSNQSLMIDFCPSYFVFGKNKIFYTQNRNLYSMNFDGSDQQLLEEINVGNGLNAYDGYVYFVDYKSGNICKFSKDDNYNITVLNNCECKDINIVEDWIFYKNSDELFALYKMKLDGTENQIVYE